MTGNYYSFDIPAALHQQLKDYMAAGNSDDSSDQLSSNYAVKFNLLYSVYSIPNIILPFFGGTIVDKLGAPYSALIFASLLLGGQILFATGVQIKSWNLMLLGRTIYGFGGESISVATSTLNSIWFQGQELALAFGINLAVSRMGSVVNNWISPSIANSVSTPFAVWFGVGMNVLSVTAIYVVIRLSILGERQCSLDDGSDGVDGLTTSLLEDYEGEAEGEAVVHTRRDSDHDEQDESREATGRDIYNLECIDNSDVNDTINDTDGSIQMHHKVMRKSQAEHGFDDGKEEDEVEDQSNGDRDGGGESGDREEHGDRDGEIDRGEEEMEAEEIENRSPNGFCSSFDCIQEVRKFNTMFWLLSASCVVVYGCVLPFNNIASGLLLERNYFTSTPTDCTLNSPGQCSSGSLAPSGGNPSMNANGDSCPVGGNVQPVLPQSIHMESSSSEDGWDHNSYQFDSLTSNDVDCGDKFWSEACTKDYCNAQRGATETSGKVMSIPYFLSAALSPFFGHMVDKVGYRAIIACFASIMLIVVHLTLALSSASPVLPLIGQGLAYTFYAAVIWPSVPLTVEEESTGTAFGAITAIQNIGLATFPLIIAAIYTASDDMYIPNVEFFFVGCAVFGTVFGVLLNVFDHRHHGTLNKVERRVVDI